MTEIYSPTSSMNDEKYLKLPHHTQSEVKDATKNALPHHIGPTHDISPAIYTDWNAIAESKIEDNAPMPKRPSIEKPVFYPIRVKGIPVDPPVPMLPKIALSPPPVPEFPAQTTPVQESRPNGSVKPESLFEQAAQTFKEPSPAPSLVSISAPIPAPIPAPPAEEKDESEIAEPPTKRKRLIKRSSSKFIETHAKDDDSKSEEDEDSAGDSEHQSIEPQGPAAAEDSESGEGKLPSLSTYRAFDQNQELEEEERGGEKSLLESTVGKRGVNYYGDALKRILIAQGRTKKTTAQVCKTVIHGDTSAARILERRVVMSMMAQTCQPEIDRIYAFDDKRLPPGTWAETMKGTVRLNSQQDYKINGSRVLKLTNNPPEHGVEAVAYAMMTIMTPIAVRSVLIEGETCIQLAHLMPTSEPFVDYTLHALRKIGQMPKVPGPIPTDLIKEVLVSVLPKWVTPDRADGISVFRHHSFFEPQIRDKPKPVPVPEPEAESNEEPLPVAKPRPSAPETHGPREFFIADDFGSGTITTSHPEALRYSITPVLKATLMADRLVVVPNDQLICLLRLRDQYFSDPRLTAELVDYIYPGGRKSAVGNLFVIPRMIIAANTDKSAAEWIRSTREKIHAADNTFFDRMYADEDVRIHDHFFEALMHALAGFLRMDSELSMQYTTARVETRRIDIETGDGGLSGRTHAIGLGTNELLQQHEFCFRALTKKFLSDMFVRYLNRIGLSTDIARYEELNLDYDQCRQQFAEKRAWAKDAETVGFRAPRVDHLEIALVAIVNSLFPPRAF